MIIEAGLSNSLFSYEDTTALICLLHTLIHGSSYCRDNGIGDCKGKHDEFVQQIFEDAKIVCENKDKIDGNWNDIRYNLTNNTYRYSTLLGQPVKLSWFDGIDTANLFIPEYEKLMKFFEIHEYNRKWLGIYIDKDGIYWKDKGYVWVNGEDMKLLEFDYVNSSEDAFEKLEHRTIGISQEDFDNNYKSLLKDYDDGLEL